MKGTKKTGYRNNKDPINNNFRLGFPTLCVVTQSGTLRRPEPQSGSGCVPTQSVGTMSLCFGKLLSTIS